MYTGRNDGTLLSFVFTLANGELPTSLLDWTNDRCITTEFPTDKAPTSDSAAVINNVSIGIGRSWIDIGDTQSYPR
jgi:hypothetical protein